MKFVALLRGVNVGGNSIIKMADLKEAVTECGFTNVRTFIQSGNVVFDAADENTAEVSARLEECLAGTFKFDIRVVSRTHEQMKKVLADVPQDWRTRDDLRRYVAFVREPVTARDVLLETEPREGVDFVQAGEGVLYMSTLLSGLTKSGFTKLIARKVYKDITIRNYNTVLKLLALMEAA